MKDDLTILLIESVNQNANLDATQKLELVEYAIRNCKEKKIGRIVMDAIESKGKKRGRPKGVTNKPKAPITRSENQQRMINIAKEDRYG